MATISSSRSEPRSAVVGWRWPSIKLLPWLLLAAIAVVVLYPLGMVVLASFRTTAPGLAGEFTLDAWQQIAVAPEAIGAILTTFKIVIPKVCLAVTIASAFAWTMARTNIPFKSLLEGALAFMFFVPTLPWMLSWVLLISPRSGFLNQALASVLPGDFRFNAYSYEALVVLGAMASVPIPFLLLYPAFLNIDPALEEAAHVSGANRLTLLWRVTLPLLAPAILAAAALSTVVGMESFEVEQLLGTPAGIYVFTTRIYDLLYFRDTPRFGAASALSMVLLAFTVMLLFVQRQILARQSFVTVSGKAFRPRTVDLGRWRWVALAIAVTYLVISGVLPFAILALNSLMQVSGFIDVQMVTTRGWSKALSSPQLMTAVQNTILVGLLTATLGVVVSSVASYTVSRLRWRGRALMDAALWLPIAIPGMVLALGFLWAFVGLPIYKTIWVLVLAFVIRGLPTSSRFFTSTMVQVSPELEEAARVHGVTWRGVALRIWRPILQPAIVGAWIYLFVIAVRTLDSALLLTGPGSEVLSVSIFQQTSRGDNVVASALAIMQVGIVLVAYVLARLVGRHYLTAH
ncbi:MAG: iron ABC transporter permease [Chloroflexota bacterium]